MTTWLMEMFRKFCRIGFPPEKVGKRSREKCGDRCLFAFGRQSREEIQQRSRKRQKTTFCVEKDGENPFGEKKGVPCGVLCVNKELLEQKRITSSREIPEITFQTVCFPPQRMEESAAKTKSTTMMGTPQCANAAASTRRRERRRSLRWKGKHFSKERFFSEEDWKNRKKRRFFPLELAAETLQRVAGTPRTHRKRLLSRERRK